jgi:predicted nucleic acid-binding protein
MNGETQLIDTNILVHAYAVSDEKKHRLALEQKLGSAQNLHG